MREDYKTIEIKNDVNDDDEGIKKTTRGSKMWYLQASLSSFKY